MRESAELGFEVCTRALEEQCSSRFKHCEAAIASLEQKFKSQTSALEDRLRLGVVGTDAEAAASIPASRPAVASADPEYPGYSEDALTAAIEVHMRDLEASLRIELDDLQERCRHAGRDGTEAVSCLATWRQVEQEIGSQKGIVEQVYVAQKEFASRIEEHEFRLATLRTR